MLEQGNTKIIASVYGPREVDLRIKSATFCIIPLFSKGKAQEPGTTRPCYHYMRVFYHLVRDKRAQSCLERRSVDPDALALLANALKIRRVRERELALKKVMHSNTSVQPYFWFTDSHFRYISNRFSPISIRGLRYRHNTIEATFPLIVLFIQDIHLRPSHPERRRYFFISFENSYVTPKFRGYGSSDQCLHSRAHWCRNPYAGEVYLQILDKVIGPQQDFVTACTVGLLDGKTVIGCH